MENTLTKQVIAGDLMEKIDRLQVEVSVCEAAGAFDRSAKLMEQIDLLEEQIAFRMSILGLM